MMQTLIFPLLFLPLFWAGCVRDLACDESFDKCYKYVSESQPYFTAEEKCVSLGGHLVSILNAFENAVVGESADSKLSGYNDYWIGANYLIKNKWSWADGSSWNFVNWFPGEPSAQTAASMCQRSKMWTSGNPDNRKPYVCQLPYSAKTATCSPTTPLPTCPTCPVCPTITTPTTTACPHIPHCESTWTYYVGTNSCYKEFFLEAFWDAENVCNEHGSHLTSIHSDGENEFVSNLATMGRAVDGHDPTWIGLHQAQNQWYWTDETQTSFFSWGAWPGSGDCIGIFPWGYTGDSGWTNKWYRFSCLDQLRNFVCKKPAL